MSTSSLESRWLTPEQAAELLPFGNADWVRIQLRTGALRGSKVKGRWVVDPSAVTDMVEAGSNTTTRRRRQRATS